MYNEWFSHLSKTLQKDLFFLPKIQMVQAKMNCILIYLFTASFAYKNTRATYSQKH